MARAKRIDYTFWSIVLFPPKVLSWLIIAAFFGTGIFMFLVVGMGLSGYLLGIPWLVAFPGGDLSITGFVEGIVATLIGSLLAFRLVRYFS